MYDPLSSDPCSLFFLVLVCYALGARAVENAPGLRLAGLRFAFVVLLVNTAWCWYTDRPTEPEHWLSIAIASLSLSALALGLSWIALTVLAFLVEHLFSRPLAAIAAGMERASWRRRDRRERRRAERDRKREQVAYERNAPERERARLQLEAQAAERATIQRRRQDARAKALLSFSYHSTVLGDRFTRASFDEFVNTFMGDELPADDVEQRGQELRSLLQLLAQDVRPAKSEMTIEAITEWHVRELAKIESLPILDAMKSFLRAGLNQRCHDLITGLLRNATP